MKGTTKSYRDNIRAKERTKERTEERTVLTGWYVPSCPSTHGKSIMRSEKSKVEELEENK